jgi:hypothetical protein
MDIKAPSAASTFLVGEVSIIKNMSEVVGNHCSK